MLSPMGVCLQILPLHHPKPVPAPSNQIPSMVCANWVQWPACEESLPLSFDIQWYCFYRPLRESSAPTCLLGVHWRRWHCWILREKGKLSPLLLHAIAEEDQTALDTKGTRKRKVMDQYVVSPSTHHLMQRFQLVSWPNWPFFQFAMGVHRA